MASRLLRTLLSPRFLRYGLVGGSGVLVTQLALFVLKELLGVHQNVAYLLAIECAVLSNFVLNDRWTFGDRRRAKPWRTRLARFHLVSGVGMAINALVFVVTIALLFTWLFDAAEVERYFGGPQTWAERHLLRPITAPPEIGLPWTYLAPFAGVATATLWNFFANLVWTWGRDTEGRALEAPAPPP